MRLSFLRLLGVLPAALSFCSPAYARKTDVLEPIGNWSIDFANDSCAMRRAFGTAEQPTVLELRRFAPGSGMQVTVATDALKITKQPFDYRFDPEPKPLKPSQWNYANFSGDRHGVVFRGHLNFAEAQRATETALRDIKPTSGEIRVSEDQLIADGAKVSSLTLTKAFNHDLRLQTGPLDETLREIRACFDDLYRGWGLDVEAHHALSRNASPINVDMVARMMRYPPKMLAQGLEGVVSVRLLISKSGGVTGCYIQDPISDPAFDRSTCGDLEHELVFEPALDKNGRPIDSYWINQVYYRIPD